MVVPRLDGSSVRSCTTRTAMSPRMPSWVIDDRMHLMPIAAAAQAVSSKTHKAHSDPAGQRLFPAYAQAWSMVRPSCVHRWLGNRKTWMTSFRLETARVTMCDAFLEHLVVSQAGGLADPINERLMLGVSGGFCARSSRRMLFYLHCCAIFNRADLLP